MAAWERINGVVYGVIGLHLFVYFATVSCVVRRVRHHLSRIPLHLHCTALSKHACAANWIPLTLQLHCQLVPLPGYLLEIMVTSMPERRSSRG